MKIKIKLSRTNETKELRTEEGTTINDVLKKIDLKPDTVIVMENDKPLPIDDKIKDRQELTIIQVSSGG